MNPGEMISELMAYFASGKYPDAVLTRMRSMVESIAEEDRKPVLDHLVETQKASFKISVAEIVEACKELGVGYRESRYVPATDWFCDACGHRFRYAQAVSDDDKIDKDLHDVCPMCGFQPSWTIQRDEYARAGNLSAAFREWYDGLAGSMPEKHGPKALEGLYWARSRAEAERRDARRKPLPPEWLRKPRVNEPMPAR